LHRAERLPRLHMLDDVNRPRLVRIVVRERQIANVGNYVRMDYFLQRIGVPIGHVDADPAFLPEVSCGKIESNTVIHWRAIRSGEFATLEYSWPALIFAHAASLLCSAHSMPSSG